MSQPGAWRTAESDLQRAGSSAHTLWQHRPTSATAKPDPCTSGRFLPFLLSCPTTGGARRHPGDVSFRFRSQSAAGLRRGPDPAAVTQDLANFLICAETHKKSPVNYYRRLAGSCVARCLVHLDDPTVTITAHLVDRVSQRKPFGGSRRTCNGNESRILLSHDSRIGLWRAARTPAPQKSDDDNCSAVHNDPI